MTRGLAAAILLALAAGRPVGAQHAGDMLVGYLPGEGGRLALVYDFAARVRVTCTFGACDGAPLPDSVYTATDPGWDAMASPIAGVAPLPAGTPITVQIAAIDPGVSVRIGPTVLSAPGESRSLGAVPNIHTHPSWQLILPGLLEAERTVSFRLTTTAYGYPDSAVYTAVLSNTTSIPPPSTTSTLPGGGGSTTTTTTTIGVASTTTTTQGTASSTTSTTLAHPAEPLPGDSLAIDTTRKRLRIVLQSRHRGIELGSDPTPGSGGLRLAGGGGRFEVAFALPGRRWRAIRERGAVVGWRYADPRGVDGPVRSLIVRDGVRVRVVARGGLAGLDLAADPAPISVSITAAERRWCLRFGGRVRWKAGRWFTARAAAAPPHCPP